MIGNNTQSFTERWNQVKLGHKYSIKLKDGFYKTTTVVDGEKEFNEPGISHGFIHFKNSLGRKDGFCGTYYFLNNAIFLE